ncbi:response regulator transcription factor [Sporomusa sp.]|uniref:response regulator transcription factor n=1 Tax=Sporomusa sp. TaxID=2078658 RepID=UPI002B707651|nr:response regulator transcription factor [Sporomusa sp.]HWR43420.1 response regulator transcription factor [Sporomusa sp.]
MKLLLIEDERRLAEALSHILKKHGYAVDTALDGETGLDMAATGIYDILILDCMLPVRDGISVLKEFRGLGFETPVIFLTAKDSTKDRVEGLDAGADDYLVKPFSSDELMARLRALSRRQTKLLPNEKLEAAGWVLDPLRCEVTKDNEIIKLTTKEALLLELLMRNYGLVVSKERIWEKIWGFQTNIDIANVDLYIHYLRRKLNTSFIKTVRGIGYYLRGEGHVS